MNLLSFFLPNLLIASIVFWFTTFGFLSDHLSSHWSQMLIQKPRSLQIEMFYNSLLRFNYQS